MCETIMMIRSDRLSSVEGSAGHLLEQDLRAARRGDHPASSRRRPARAAKDTRDMVAQGISLQPGDERHRFGSVA